MSPMSPCCLCISSYVILTCSICPMFHASSISSMPLPVSMSFYVPSQSLPCPLPVSSMPCLSSVTPCVPMPLSMFPCPCMVPTYFPSYVPIPFPMRSPSTLPSPQPMFGYIGRRIVNAVKAICCSRVEIRKSFLCDHWCPCFGLLVMSALGFKVRVHPLVVCFVTCSDFLDSPLVWHLLTSWQPAL